MFSLTGNSSRACDGITRRELLRVGGLSLLPSVSLTRLLQAKSRQYKRLSRAARSVVLVNLFDGPSHLDMFDMKPAAPTNIRGEPIADVIA